MDDRGMYDEKKSNDRRECRVTLSGRNDRRRVSGLYGELPLPAHRMGFDLSVRRLSETKETSEGVFLTDCLRLVPRPRGGEVLRTGPGGAAISPPGFWGKTPRQVCQRLSVKIWINGRIMRQV